MRDTCHVQRGFRCLALVLLLVAASGAGGHAAERYRVAFVTDIGGVEPAIHQANLAGLRRAVRDFGVEARVVVQPARTSSTSTFEALARQRYDLIIAPLGGGQAAAVAAAAREYPEQRFVLGDTRRAEVRLVTGGPVPANIQTVTAREEEIGFVVGYLAGLVERRRPGPDAVGSVGGWNVGPVVRFIAGYRAGARRASPRARLLNSFAFDFWDPGPCERIAEEQIAKGAGVVFDVAGNCGLGALAAVRERGVFGIGVDVDQSSLGQHILTSAVKDVGFMNYRTIELLVAGRLESGGDTLLGLREGALHLGRVSPRVPQPLVERALEIQRAIASGRISGIPTRLSR
jgi:basic membrane protein A